MTIKGTITRLVEPGRIFFRPAPETDMRQVDGKHRLASGELVATGVLSGREIGGDVVAELSAGNPNDSTLTAQ